MTGSQHVLKVAALSRVVLVILCLLSDALLPDHEPDPTVARPPVPVPKWLKAFTRWDSAQFLRVAVEGYASEESYAFFPLLPVLVRLFSWPARMLGCGAGAAYVLSGVALTNVSFVVSAWALYRLTLRFMRDEHLAVRTAQMYCFTPANVFMGGSIYSEAPFAACTFVGLLYLDRDQPILAALLLGAATSLRANGVLAAGFLLHHLLLEGLRLSKQSRSGATWRALCFLALQALLLVVVAVAPFVLFQIYAYRRECGGLRPQGPAPTPSWCHQEVPSVYRYVQATYWQNGFLRYFQWKQLPNFLLAAPTLLLAASGTDGHLRYFLGQARRQGLGRALLDASGLPYVVHCAALVGFVALWGNVQVVTRLVAAACPAHHWHVALATRPPRSGAPLPRCSTQRLIWAHYAVWNVLGIVMHPNFLPWT